jgi:glycosyltransferase involved in cell wall biosynthesis
MRTHRLLIVSPHFPPVNAPDMQRARQCLPYLADHGWEAEVLAVSPEDVAMPLDARLAVGLPASVPVHRVRAWPLALCRSLGVGSLGLRAQRALGRAGSRLLESGHFDLVFFTTTQFPVLSLGAVWQRRHGVPYVVDWQDPWVTDYYSRPGAPPPPGGWKYRFAAWNARRSEPRVLASAAGLVSTSAEYVEQLRTRYPWFASRPAAVIPFGVEPSDFALAAAAEVAPGFTRRPGVRHIVYVGAAGPIMRPALEFLFQAVGGWLKAHPDRRPGLRLHFLGTSYAPAGRQLPSVQPLADAAGIGDLVEEQPARLGHFAALKTMQAADDLLLLGTTDAGYSPSKIATLALSGRPVLALIPGGGQLERQLADTPVAQIARFSPSAETDRIHAYLDHLPARVSASSLLGLTAKARTAELLAFLGRVIQLHSSSLSA